MRKKLVSFLIRLLLRNQQPLAAWLGKQPCATNHYRISIAYRL